jgi:hypothetical protein
MLQPSTESLLPFAQWVRVSLQPSLCSSLVAQQHQHVVQNAIARALHLKRIRVQQSMHVSVLGQTLVMCIEAFGKLMLSTLDRTKQHSRTSTHDTLTLDVTSACDQWAVVRTCRSISALVDDGNYAHVFASTPMTLLIIEWPSPPDTLSPPPLPTSTLPKPHVAVDDTRDRSTQVRLSKAGRAHMVGYQELLHALNRLFASTLSLSSMMVCLQSLLVAHNTNANIDTKLQKSNALLGTSTRHLNATACGVLLHGASGVGKTLFVTYESE